MSMKSNSTLIVDIYHQAKHVGEYSLTLFMEGYWRLKDYFFYLEGENSVYYKDFEQIRIVLLKASVTESIFNS